MNRQDGTPYESRKSTTLLAPSTPRRRRWTPFLITSLHLLASIQVIRDAIARRFRNGSYRRYGAETAAGAPLALAVAARQLGSTPSTTTTPTSQPVVVILSSDDPRHVEPGLFAAQLGATVLDHPRRHFPGRGPVVYCSAYSAGNPKRAAELSPAGVGTLTSARMSAMSSLDVPR